LEDLFRGINKLKADTDQMQRDVKAIAQKKDFKMVKVKTGM
jgi:hypothetical protein